MPAKKFGQGGFGPAELLRQWLNRPGVDTEDEMVVRMHEAMCVLVDTAIESTKCVNCPVCRHGHGEALASAWEALKT